MRQTYFTTILCIGLAGFFMHVESQTERSISSYTTGDSSGCVCQPHITINPPICARAVPMNSGAGCNSSILEDIVSSEQENTRRQVEDLQEKVSSELMDIKQQLKMLTAAVTSIAKFLLQVYPKDCSEALLKGVRESGVYMVQPQDTGEAFQVYCDMETDGGGWTVFQRRKDGSVDFYLDFANYSQGFGDLEGEFWLGNDNLHRLTAQGEYELRVDLSNFENVTAYAVYASFSIANVSDNYRLTAEHYSGTAGDSLGYHNNQTFKTSDSCAQSYHAAWWYYSCYHSNLNGVYFNEASDNTQGIKWYGILGRQSLKTSEMKIRSKG